MKRYNRIFTIVLDSLGIGQMPDAARFGDEGADTLGHILDHMGTLDMPNLRKLGLLDLHTGGQMTGTGAPMARCLRLSEASNGKDTMTGHWEMMGIFTEKPFQTFTDTGFPPELIAELEKRCGKRVIGNKSASGTAIIDELGLEEINTGAMIVYTSADSVMQICGHEETFDLQNLYRCCEIARELCHGKYAVGRVIARPFAGEYPNFTRTANRHDFSLQPPEKTALDLLSEAGFDTIGVGKIYDIFAGRGVSEKVLTKGNTDGLKKCTELLERDFNGLCFINLVDFDMIYGHRRDAKGYANALIEFDQWLGTALSRLDERDVLMITADHGCDPGAAGTDHTREFTPLLAAGKAVRPGVNLGTRETFADIGATVLRLFGVENKTHGTSFADQMIRLQ